MQTLWLIIGMVLGGFAVWVFMRAHVRNALGARREALEKRQRAIEQLVKPMAEGLDRVRGELEQLERARRESHGSLTTHMRSVAESQERLRSETASLVTALRSPVTRG